MLKKILLGATAIAFATSIGASTAFAANGKAEQGNGRSICMFSGLNDDPTEAFPDDGQVQSYGQLVKKLGVETIRFIIEIEEMDVQGLGVPGLECNPNTGPDLHAAP